MPESLIVFMLSAIGAKFWLFHVFPFHSLEQYLDSDIVFSYLEFALCQRLRSGLTPYICVAGSPFDDRTITADEDHSSDVVLNEINSQYRNQQAPWDRADQPAGQTV